MRAVILAAGLCSRLRPHSDGLPKGLLPLGNSTPLDRQVAILRAAGIADIAMVIGYCADRLREHFGKDMIKFIENPAYASTGSVFSLFLARAFAEHDSAASAILDYGYDVQAGDANGPPRLHPRSARHDHRSTFKLVQDKDMVNVRRRPRSYCSA